ncbi:MULTISPECIES: phage baseplate assembly protein [Pasteurellaceae]|uniref:Phage tail protein n=1 Tax=Pasteurella atlantica TaxID=2827233 RepID=A0AAW8CJ18_9PAST|nr:phage tail protein [Pasteurella atlantica]MBR0574067.1 phage tail protein [Pasteurella atlantica]MDP8040110.1 phage tail protein [Pasteurella atlantica]MDP8042223.1 phage tail protein [Pasteurella atlantica]MDP8044370.1 phage tail protein [Pasteurella atlantica]MDP8046382.1 phage tail protein [Pasteurella atlantica]
MIKNDIVVEIDGKQHKDWKSYDIDSDFLIAADAFSFDLGITSDVTKIEDLTWKEAKVMINGETVLTGIVDTTSRNTTKHSRGYSINGRDRASILVDCSAPITNVKGLTVFDAVKKIVKPLGITKVTLKAEKNPTLDKVDIEIGETAWTAIMRCANSAGLHCWFDSDGTLIVGGADYSSPPVATLQCVKNGKNNNFSEINEVRDISQSYSEVTFLAQKHGRSNDSSKHDLKWVYKDPNVKIYKQKTVVLSDIENLEALKKAAKKWLSDRKLEELTLTITVPDHKTQDGVLWKAGQRVHIISDEYDIDAIFFLMGRRFMLSRSGGTQTELRFKEDGVWTPDAYTKKSEKARKRKGKGKRDRELIVLGGD